MWKVEELEKNKMKINIKLIAVFIFWKLKPIKNKLMWSIKFKYSKSMIENKFSYW